MMEITLTSLFIVSSLAASPAGDGTMGVIKSDKAYSFQKQTEESENIENIENLFKEESINNKPHTLEEHVRDYFSDTPILAEVAKCESTFRHFGKDGKPIRGIENGQDVGLMQINERYHGKSAKENGFDIYSLEGNMAYAKWLYKRSGSAPWVHSSKCWKKYEKVAIK